MKFTNEIVNTIKTFIIDNIAKHSNDILSVTIEHFHISKPTATKYLNELIESNVIKRDNRGRYPNYHLVDTVVEHTYSIADKLEEDIIWRNDYGPLLSDVSQNIRQACQYGFTEMVNNAIDHSGSDKIKITLSTNARDIRIQVLDYGIGIFQKIMNYLGLDKPKTFYP